MADLKTYLGISDTDIKSVSGLPANDTKTILDSKLKYFLIDSEGFFLTDSEGFLLTVKS